MTSENAQDRVTDPPQAAFLEQDTWPPWREMARMVPSVRDPAVQAHGTPSDGAPAAADGATRYLALLTCPDGMLRVITMSCGEEALEFDASSTHSLLPPAGRGALANLNVAV